jgi:hypothetical protein
MSWCRICISLELLVVLLATCSTYGNLSSPSKPCSELLHLCTDSYPCYCSYQGYRISAMALVSAPPHKFARPSCHRKLKSICFVLTLSAMKFRTLCMRIRSRFLKLNAQTEICDLLYKGVFLRNVSAQYEGLSFFKAHSSPVDYWGLWHNSKCVHYRFYEWHTYTHTHTLRGLSLCKRIRSRFLKLNAQTEICDLPYKGVFLRNVSAQYEGLSFFKAHSSPVDYWGLWHNSKFVHYIN